ncbi:hypothetical protein DRW48_14315 [Paracoccus suum]|uniref:TetR/AcrR family transcriptional regulator n=2 Tax=Paracoccus suum TaxID=2259340 RepID=A0A344PMU4_9RHOB|nr:hypothetical protein DRW48_14315 [Paracoccus suum]
MVRTAEMQFFDVLPGVNLLAIAEAAGVSADLAERLFPNEDALGVAVVENLMVRLIHHLSRRTTAAPAHDPVAQFRALFDGYVEWAVEHSSSAAVLAERNAAAVAGKRELEKYDRAINGLAQSLLRRAAGQGRLVEGLDIKASVYHGRALTLGLTRMSVSTNPLSRPRDKLAFARACRGVMEQYYGGLFRAPQNGEDQPIRSEA